ncbi:MAG TPA: potassium/proton antiporter [Longimicrobiaceae bacterium]|nr:potassium/proton antiporter [Longimicrobiaceae bacterium]
MFPVDRLILIGALLLLVGVASSKVSSRFGVPVLVLFLAVGMLAGSDGPGGIAFENYQLAHGVGTLALAVILFDGGLRTSLASLRLAWRPALALASGGVLVCALLTGAAAAWILGLPLLVGVLLGSIVGSTDAAAVFSVLRGQGLNLRRRLSATLEIESGSNDPMAVFLTVGILEVLLGRLEPGPEILVFLLRQAGLGAAAGLLVGWAAVRLVNRINLSAAGLYPVFVGGFGLLAYGAAASLGGSGFLAVYLAGIVVGNRRVVFQRGVLLFHDGVAWLAQISMFVLLGLLSFPGRLLEVAGEGLLIAAVLLFVARPLAVAVSLAPFRFAAREVAFVAWAGLRGAVPIILATYPLLLGLPGSELIFDVVFFVVIASVVVQGLTLPALAGKLGLQVPTEPGPPVTLEITSLRDVDGDIVEYSVREDSRAAGRRLRDLALPDGAVVALVAREQQIVPPRGSTPILAGDHVFLVLRPEVRALVDRVFASGGEPLPVMPEEVEFPLLGSATVGDLEEFYGMALDAPAEWTLDRALRERLGEGEIRPGARAEYGAVTLVVREVSGEGRVERVGFAIHPAAPEPGEASIQPEAPPGP